MSLACTRMTCCQPADTVPHRQKRAGHRHAELGQALLKNNIKRAQHLSRKVIAAQNGLQAVYHR